MSLTISDGLLAEAGISEADARVEIACRLFDARRLSFAQALRWAQLDRTAFEEALLVRNLSVYRPTSADLNSDLNNLRQLDASR